MAAHDAAAWRPSLIIMFAALLIGSRHDSSISILSAHRLLLLLQLTGSSGLMTTCNWTPLNTATSSR